MLAVFLRHGFSGQYPRRLYKYKILTKMPWKNNSRNDFENALYDSQYPDENADGGVQLDHSRLYVTNLPQNLNEQGLQALFSKFGNITKIHLSRDPTKRYAFIFFETASEARVAMMKLNKTEPLKLNIAIAHKKNNQDRNENNNSRSSRNFDRRSMDDYEATGRSNHWSAGVQTLDEDRNSDGQNELYEEEMLEDEIEMEEDMDLDVRLQMLNLKEAEIKLKKKMLFLNQQKKLSQQAQQANRSILPDGRIVVRNIADRAPVQENFSSAPADSRDATCACVVCGAAAEAFCSRCGHTPYCGVQCQRADWNTRHRSVCHNLARLTDGIPDMNKIDAEPSVPPAQPLRPPRSLNKSQNLNSSRDQGNDDSDSQKKYQTRDTRGPRERNNNQNNYNQKNNRNGPKNQNGRQNRQNNNSRPADEEESFETNGPKPLLSMKIPKPEGLDTKPEPKARPEPVRIAPEPVPGPAPKPHPAKQPDSVPKLQPLRQPAQEPQPGSSPKPQPVTPAAPAVNVQETKIVPKQYLPETLAMGSIMMLSLEAAAKTEKPGFVCLALSEDAAAAYQMLCEDFTEDCAKTTEIYKPTPGETFSYLNPEDGAWYRARCLTPTTAAFIDSGSIVTTQPDGCRRLPSKYEPVVEFCCQLDARGVQVGDNLTCTLLEKVGDTFKVSLARDGADIGTGQVFRWLPPVEKPAASAAPALPEVSRPDVCAGAVVLVEGGAERTFVRAATPAALDSFSQALEDVLHAGMQGRLKQLKAPPQKGEMVIGKFTDGLHYRALCKRTNVKQNKYMLEYIEYGNIEISKLEDMYECPPEFTLEAKPTAVSMVKLQLQSKTLSEKATDYLATLRDESTELTLSFPNGASSGPSGSEVILTLKNESVNAKLDDLSLPEWKKLELKGVDIVEIPPMMFSEIKYMQLPPAGKVDILDATMIEDGTLSACPPRTQLVLSELADLTKQMEEYCNSKIGGTPYLPRPEELCIAKSPITGEWIRGAMCEQAGGAGGGAAHVAPLDGSALCDVPVSLLRKMLPEFMRLPALASLIDVRGFPKNPTPQQLQAAREHMQLDARGQGTLRVSRCERVEKGMYDVDAPELLKAMGL